MMNDLTIQEIKVLTFGISVILVTSNCINLLGLYSISGVVNLESDGASYD